MHKIAIADVKGVLFIRQNIAVLNEIFLCHSHNNAIIYYLSLQVTLAWEEMITKDRILNE